MYGMTPMGVFFTAIFPLEINEQALCQQPQFVPKSARSVAPPLPTKSADFAGYPLFSKVVLFMALSFLNARRICSLPPSQF